MKYGRSMKTKFKIGLRRGFALMTALIMALTSVTPQMAVNAAATNTPMSMVFLSGNPGSYDCIYAFNLNGRVAYCMDHGKAAHSGNIQFTQGNGSTLSKGQRIQLALCMYYGYSAVNGNRPITSSTAGSANAAHYAATQGMVWSIEKNMFGDTGWRSRWMGMLSGADFSTDEAVAFYDRLVSKIKTASSLTDTVPSFTKEKKNEIKTTNSLEWNEGTGRYEVTLTDDKKVLCHFKLDKKSAGKYHAEYDDAHPNRVTIWTKKANAPKTTLEFVVNKDELGKYDTINMAADEKILENWVSEAGESHEVLRLPAGNYILREESAPYGYKLANDVEFTVEDAGKVRKVYMKDEPVTGIIRIRKIDTAIKKNISGAAFEILDDTGGRKE